MKTAIQVGASKEAIREARESIIAIMKTVSADIVKSEALRTLAIICEVKGTTITGCTIGVK